MHGEMRDEARLSVRARVAGDRGPRLEVELHAGPGLTAVMGRSGAGKSTLLMAIAGLVRPEEGRIVLDGVELFESRARLFVPPHRRRVALVFQSLALFPHLRTWENVAYGIRGLPRQARRARALAWLARMRIEHLGERSPASLSGGEAQRVALARALASEPRALLLDEPFSALDPALRAELGAELTALVDEVGIPALLVTHHAEDASTLSRRVISLDAGRVVEDRPTRGSSPGG